MALPEAEVGAAKAPVVSVPVAAGPAAQAGQSGAFVWLLGGGRMSWPVPWSPVFKAWAWL